MNASLIKEIEEKMQGIIDSEQMGKRLIKHTLPFHF